jgi:hypothetical protein
MVEGVLKGVIEGEIEGVTEALRSTQEHSATLSSTQRQSTCALS